MAGSGPPDADMLGAISAALLGLLGRLMSMSQERRSPFSVSLLWELPAAIGLGVIGRGVGEYVGLSGFPLMSCSIALAYLGPRFISFAIGRLMRLPEK